MTTPGIDWDPDQYRRFRDQRRQPFVDLMNMLEARTGMRVVDLGCGPGELTRTLHDHVGAATTVGIDSSEAMLARAAQHADGDAVRFEPGDIGALGAVGQFDLVFSNAALHWLPDHEALIPRLCSAVAPGGQIAIQVPANHDHISHLVADEIARERPFCAELDGFQRGTPVLDPRAYDELLHQLGYRRRVVRMQIYGHELPSVDHVVEWVKGSLLTAYQKRLTVTRFAGFLEHYSARLHELLGDERPFYYTYKRILIWAAKPA